VVNGEIYLSDTERKNEKLEDFHEFKGGSDLEMVIPLYQKYGVNFLSKLRGEFALVLYDSERQLLVVDPKNTNRFRIACRDEADKKE
jgi:asparagine synthase (glutamine-hydrolysing)